MNPEAKNNIFPSQIWFSSHLGLLRPTHQPFPKISSVLDAFNWLEEHTVDVAIFDERIVSPSS